MTIFAQHGFKLARVAAMVSLAFASVQSWAVDAFQVKDIQVEGLQRVEPGTVFATLPFRVGESYSDEKGASAIRSLFALGLFKDVRIEVNGDTVVLIVEERPTISKVDFIGTKEFDKDTLTKALKDIGLTEGRPFDKALADRAEQELKRQYVNRSLYGAEIITTITPVDRNRVNLSFTVVEGDLAKIKEIHVVGAKAFSEDTLLKQLDQSVGNWMSWYTKSDRYSRTKLNADLEALRAYYQSRGYLEFRVDSTQVAISPDKQSITITINVTEGNLFVVSEVAMEGNFLGKEDEFKSLLNIKVGKPYNVDDVVKTTKAFNDFFANFGYAFARTESRPEIDRENNRVKLVLVSDPARRVYVRRINVSGNSKTRDEIVRREMRQMESSWYDGQKIKLSKDRIQRTGYFKDVDLETQEVVGTADQVDLNVNITEKPTGMVNLGAGYSSLEKFTVMFGISQDNIFGTGHNLSLQVNTGSINRAIVLSETNPYFTEDGVSRTVDLYHRVSRPYATVTQGDYQIITTGTTLRFGIPVTELDRIFLGMGYENIHVVDGLYIPTTYAEYVATHGATNNSFPVTLGWARDSRDSYLNPNSGRYLRLNSETSLAGDIRYAKLGAQYQEYYPFNKQYTFAFNINSGIGKGLDGQSLPFFKNYFSGGLGSVRGFAPGSLGYKITQSTPGAAPDVGPFPTTTFSTGGNRLLTINNELQMPFPGVGNDRTLRLVTFVDAGNVWGESETFNLNTLRASMGVGLSWVSPMGPLRLSWARPIRSFDNDTIQHIQFQIGTAF
jgi:outer membrane protein insertion porin family